MFVKYFNIFYAQKRTNLAMKSNEKGHGGNYLETVLMSILIFCQTFNYRFMEDIYWRNVKYESCLNWLTRSTNAISIAATVDCRL